MHSVLYNLFIIIILVVKYKLQGGIMASLFPLMFENDWDKDFKFYNARIIFLRYLSINRVNDLSRICPHQG